MEQLYVLRRSRMGLLCVSLAGFTFSLFTLLAFSSSNSLLLHLHRSWLHNLFFSSPSSPLPAKSFAHPPANPPFSELAPSSEFFKEPSDVKIGDFHSASVAPAPTPASDSHLHPPALASSPSRPPPSSISPVEAPPKLSLSSGSNDISACDISVGEWVLDGSHYPLFPPRSCPYVDEAFSCQENGRPDSDYLKRRWKPKGCDLPRFDAQSLLEKLRGKRMVFAGDSLMRNQWESMLCLLREGLANKSRMIEAKGSRITKGKGDYVFKFLDYNARVEFYRSHFLVAEGRQGKRLTLRLDIIDKTSKKWLNADVLVFTTGHWWTHGKTARGKDYFQERDFVHESLPVMEAFQKGMKTWASWIGKNVDPKRTKLFFCGYSPAHFNGGQWNSGGQCNKETEPIFNASLLSNYPEKMLVIENIVQQMKLPVQILNVTRLSEFRKDAHPSRYGQVPQDNKSGRGPHQDCSHWCLPGLPDIWNERRTNFVPWRLKTLPWQSNRIEGFSLLKSGQYIQNR
ncbi:hypothetical protein GOP47_0011199 [Adiantum capillus-veneris]|uniref:Trichome birefringence-like N-terminal domain-containing protein n=1 Tax=Adiantum capillus-veneris TaxID=13818 RepID=A0A9D4USU3_ADICA|nr:hypothetical protein GOP47_0011199 [Adiantum capillus-veneris]